MKKGNGRVAVAFCYGQSTVTPQWRFSYTMVLMRDAASNRRIVGEFAHEASAAHIALTRNEMVEEFLAHPLQPEWLWICDTDATFGDDVLERLIAAADPVERPIVGALAFGVRPAGGGKVFNAVGAAPLELFPTIYAFTETGEGVWFDYPRNEIVQCSGTGCHCILIHRTVLSDGRWRQDDHPHPWFRMAFRNGQEVSEDRFFCLKAGALGYPIHVHTGIRTGHVKTFIADEDYYLAQRQPAALGAPSSRTPSPLTDRIDVVIPTYGRADRLQRVAENVIEATERLQWLVFVVEADDQASIDAIDKLPDLRIRTVVNDRERTYAGAINAAVDTISSEWLFTGADDLRFEPGWDIIALTHARHTGAKVVGTNDEWNQAVLAGIHSTHTLVALDYINELGATGDGIPGKVLHEYDHNFVDNELVQVAMSRGVYAHCHTAVVEHLHPLAEKGEWDATYEAGMKEWDADEALFRERSKLWTR